MRVCHTCHEELPDDVAFCGNCGTPVPPDTPVTPNAAPTPAEGRRRSWVLPVAVCVIALLIVGAIAALLLSQRHSPTSTSATPPGVTPTTTPVTPPTSVVTTTVTPPSSTSAQPGSARDQALAVETIISQSIQDRSNIDDAITEIKNCQDVELAAQRIEAVVADRRAGLKSAKSLAVSKLKNGPAIRIRLVRVMADNLRADDVWIDWSHLPCVPQRPNPPIATPLNDIAHQDKAAFLDAWTPVARQFHFPVPPPPGEAGSL